MDRIAARKNPTSSQRLLTAVLNSEKAHVDALFQALALSHNSQAALAAYASAGRDEPLGLAVGGVVGVLGEEYETRQEAYASSLSSTRLALKEIRDAEDSLANVIRDRDILVQRMVKQTSKKPSKSDLRNSTGSGGSIFGLHHSRDSASISSSNASHDKASKLEEAQLELAGCEETLKREQVQLDAIRRRVIKECLEHRLRNLEALGTSTQAAAKRALVELHTYLHEGAPFEDHHNIPRQQGPYTPSVDSNTPSLAPSQSASQIGRDRYDYSSDEDSLRSPSASIARRQANQHSSAPIRGLASVIESGGSSSEDETRLKVVENTAPRQRAVSQPSPLVKRTGPTVPPQAPSSRWNNRRSASSITDKNLASRAYGSGSDSDDGTLRNGQGRKTQSDVGGRGKRPSMGKRRSSASSVASSYARGSETASIKRKKGFFSSFKSFFGGGSSKRSTGGSEVGSIRSDIRNTSARRGGSPDSLVRASGGAWSTRTNRNLRNAGSGGLIPKRGGGKNDGSSSDEDASHGRAGLVAVTNVNRFAGGKGSSKRDSASTAVSADLGEWKVENVGLQRPGVKRNSSSKTTLKGIAATTTPITPAAATSSSFSGGVSRSATTKTLKSKSGLSNGSPVEATMTSQPPAAISSKPKIIKRSSSTSAASASASATGKTSGNPRRSASTAFDLNSTKPKILTTSQTSGPSLSSLVEIKAPKGLNPSLGLTLPTAPGSSIVRPSAFEVTTPIKTAPSPSSLAPPKSVNNTSSLTTSPSKRSVKSASNSNTGSSTRPLSTFSNSDRKSENTHVPSHRSTSPLPRSAMKPTRPLDLSPEPRTGNANELPKLISATAPPPLSFQPAQVSQPVHNPAQAAISTFDDAASVYETGVEDNNEDDEQVNPVSAGLASLNLGGVLGSSPVSAATTNSNVPASAVSSNSTALGPSNGNGNANGENPQRRKSVRMAVPPSMTEFPSEDNFSKREPVNSNGVPVNNGNGSSYVPTGSSHRDDVSAVSSAYNGASSKPSGSWNSKIDTASTGVWGAVDSSEDEDENETDYAIARRAMERAQRHWEKAGKDKGKDKRKGKERA
ncbi:hypothetical protein [Phaffia rhodozyma]|uniref:Uncharacterized protein n=1 Tax=Phaffia rhodozyma TaxID=264483 RepID=A0A0F7SLB8_PHARH|nr:hypothetical protein [Phaffia rhodozyma]